MWEGHPFKLQSAHTQNFKVTGRAKHSIDLAHNAFLFYYTKLQTLAFFLTCFPMHLLIFNIWDKKQNKNLSDWWFYQDAWFYLLALDGSAWQKGDPSLKSPRAKQSPQPILTATLLAPVLLNTRISTNGMCWCLGKWPTPLSLCWKFQLLYLRLPHTLISLLYALKNEELLVKILSEAGQGMASLHDADGSDSTAIGQFLSFFITDGLNTFLFFCDTVIC